MCTKLRIVANDDRVYFDNSKPIPVSKVRVGSDADRGHDAICFFGTELPKNLTKGRQYFVIESQPEFIRVSESLADQRYDLRKSAGRDAKLITNLFHSHLALYAPKGSGPGKGAFDLVGCKNVNVRGCRLSALGDTITSKNATEWSSAITISLTGSRMVRSFSQSFARTRRSQAIRRWYQRVSRYKRREILRRRRDISNYVSWRRRGSWINQPRTSSCPTTSLSTIQPSANRTQVWSTYLFDWRI